ncbi:MAG: hypothetical protein SFV81_20200, partial [Pirellulaceae bacterium]|nr:hypothetical protein [Pirellulaceae bacterium]
MSKLKDKQRDWLNKYVDSLQYGLSDIVALKRNRIFHAASNCPKRLRCKAQFFHNGVWEQAVVVDVHAMYWAALISMLPDCPEKTELIKLIQSRLFYDEIAAEAGIETPTADDKANFKPLVQKECLFWTRGWGYWDRKVAQALDRR